MTQNMRGVTNSGYIIGSTFGTGENKTFTVLIIHNFLKMFDEPVKGYISTDLANNRT